MGSNSWTLQMKFLNVLVCLWSTGSAAVTEPVSECGHYHTKCTAPDVRTHEDYSLYSYPLSVNLWEVFNQIRDLAFHSIYHTMIQMKIKEFVEGGMTKDQAKAQMALLQQNPSINATLQAQAYAISADGDKLRTHGCWCSKSNPNIGRKTGGRATDLVDYICKLYIERNDCLMLEGGTCQNYTLKRDADPANWKMVSPTGEEYSEYWAKVWVGTIGLLIPEQAVYIEDNVDECMRAKAKTAYEVINMESIAIRGGNTPEGLANMYQAKNPFQTNWDGWKPNAYCGEENDVPQFHKKKCVGYPPHVVAVWND